MKTGQVFQTRTSTSDPILKYKDIGMGRIFSFKRHTKLGIAFLVQSNHHLDGTVLFLHSVKIRIRKIELLVLLSCFH